MVSVLTQIMSLLVGGIEQVAEGIGGGLKALVENIFINVTETSGGATTYELTTFGALVVIFAGVSLAIGLSTKIFNWVTSLGSNY